MKNLENGTEFIWPKEKFLNRLYLMKEMYNNYEEEDDDWDLPEVDILSIMKSNTLILMWIICSLFRNITWSHSFILQQEKDPFQEDLNQEITIGTVQVFLQPIAYMVSYPIISLKCNKLTIRQPQKLL